MENVQRWQVLFQVMKDLADREERCLPKSYNMTNLRKLVDNVGTVAREMSSHEQNYLNWNGQTALWDIITDSAEWILTRTDDANYIYVVGAHLLTDADWYGWFGYTMSVGLLENSVMVTYDTTNPTNKLTRANVLALLASDYVFPIRGYRNDEKARIEMKLAAALGMKEVDDDGNIYAIAAEDC